MKKIKFGKRYLTVTEVQSEEYHNLPTKAQKEKYARNIYMRRLEKALRVVI